MVLSRSAVVFGGVVMAGAFAVKYTGTMVLQVGTWRQNKYIYVICRCEKVYGLGQHFQARSHSFTLYRPSLSQQMTPFFPCGKLVLVRNGFVYLTLSLNRLLSLTNDLFNFFTTSN